jgi:hypothetical protein
MRAQLSNVAAVKRVLAAVIMLSSLVVLGIGLGVVLDVHPAAATTNPILTYAQKQQYVAYCDGGGGINGPTHGVGTPQGGCAGTTVGFDCMSLVQYAVYQGTGGQAVIPNSGSPVVDGGQVISEADLEPGDAVFMGGPGPLADYAHSAIYAGNGMIWDDFTENETVQLRTLASIQNPAGPYLFDGGVRYPTNGAGSAPVPGSPNTQSYDLVGSDGGVFAFNSPFVNSLPGLGVHVNNITGIVPTATDTGYYLVGSDGGVFAFNAPFVNSLPGIGVGVNDIVGIVPTLGDQGYFLVGSDGGVFAFNAPFEKSLPGLGIHVNDITGIAATPDDQGYWLVGSNGNVYALGDAPYLGNAPAGARGITATGDGDGYWVVGSNGAVTPFGDAGNFSDLPALGVSVNNIVGIVVTPDSQGYNLIGSDGGVFSFGDAENLGSLPGLGIHVNNVVGAVPT